ncbi:hypothetical protein GCM10017083_40520 [Thalassobaculum fulvum]|uniref:Uncharacterized protein n=1 Tax=Thalassobaculum fulvum TaxID=1633335 RepID=A0A919CR91_9PROT|nr:hypothetical protein GCM10017083_40520 [Thalassobaculum fulvum]
MTAQYVENVLGRAIVFNGSGTEDGKTGQVSLRRDALGRAAILLDERRFAAAGRS